MKKVLSAALAVIAGSAISATAMAEFDSEIKENDSTPDGRPPVVVSAPDKVVHSTTGPAISFVPSGTMPPDSVDPDHEAPDGSHEPYHPDDPHAPHHPTCPDHHHHEGIDDPHEPHHPEGIDDPHEPPHTTGSDVVVPTPPHTTGSDVVVPIAPIAPAPSPKEPHIDIIRGDVDGDKRITAKDAAYILVAVTNGEMLDPAVADFNEDGEVTALDAECILRYIVGLET